MSTPYSPAEVCDGRVEHARLQFEVALVVVAILRQLLPEVFSGNYEKRSVLIGQLLTSDNAEPSLLQNECGVIERRIE